MRSVAIKPVYGVSEAIKLLLPEYASISNGAKSKVTFVLTDMMLCNYLET